MLGYNRKLVLFSNIVNHLIFLSCSWWFGSKWPIYRTEGTNSDNILNTKYPPNPINSTKSFFGIPLHFHSNPSSSSSSSPTRSSPPPPKLNTLLLTLERSQWWSQTTLPKIHQYAVSYSFWQISLWISLLREPSRNLSPFSTSPTIASEIAFCT